MTLPLPLPVRAQRLVARFRELSERQPAPRPGTGPAVWPQAIEDFELVDGLSEDVSVATDVPAELVTMVAVGLMRDRDELGRARYRTPLQTGNGRDFLVDYLQERLDGIAYLRGQLLQQQEQGVRDAIGHALYADELKLVSRAIRLWIRHAERT